MALTIKSESSSESSSLGTLSKVSDTTAPENENPRFESLPPEIRNMIYEFLLPPARSRKKCRKSFDEPCCQFACVMHTANHAILSANRNIRREASAVFYRSVLLVSIDWDWGPFLNLQASIRTRDIAYKTVKKDAVLPPCVVHVQQKHHYRGEYTSKTSMIFAAADFRQISGRLGFWGRVPTSYSLTSLPKIDYSVDKLRKLIWSPLLRLRKSHLVEFELKSYHFRKVVDCTEIFEQSTASQNWDPEAECEDTVLLKNAGNISDIHTDSSSEEDDDESDGVEKDIDEEESGEEESDQGGNGDQEDSSHAGENEKDDAEDGIVEI